MFYLNYWNSILKFIVNTDKPDVFILPATFNVDITVALVVVIIYINII